MFIFLGKGLGGWKDSQRCWGFPFPSLSFVGGTLSCTPSLCGSHFVIRPFSHVFGIRVSWNQATMIIDGRPLKRNQVLVFKALVEHSEKTMVLFLSSEGRKRRARLMAERHHLLFPSNSLLQYHIILLDTLTICAAGKVQSVCYTFTPPNAPF